MNKISVKEFLKIKKKDIQTIDIREQYEYQDGHIDSMNIPMNQILDSIEKINTTKKVIIYCQSGRRAEAVVYMLKKMFNLNNVFNLEGGYSAYVEFKSTKV